ncbi:hypothetical protein ACJX0J_032751, partial [Zea mays]
VFKSGPLFISSKGIGWKTWKKRWFILTRTSLVFFKSDPSTLPQRSEVNLTLGGIDLNNSGSVVVREDKRLLTVLFPDGRDGRAFTLKAESSEDLFEWKTALEEALAQAPNAALVMGHNGIFRNDTTDVYEGAIPNWGKKRPIKSIVVGRPILLALEDIDGSPSFLEKALCFLEKHGMKVEGILRQAADVEEVDRRLQEYEQGRTEFAPEEDAHVVGDCVKHVLRELPSSPVPASCCTALLEAFRLETKESQIKSMRAAISETFPEPNRRLLQRLLKMMHTIASHTAENRMTPSAVAACMAPLLLRPLLAGECEMEDDLDMNGDSAAQLIAAANAANSAQGIVTTLLEEYKSIFNDEHFRCSLSPDSQTGDSGSEESTDDETVDTKGNGFHDAENDVDQELDDAERMLSGKFTETSASACADLYDHKEVNGNSSDTELFVEDHTFESNVDLNDAPLSRLTENGKGPSNLMSAHETPLSVGEILLSLDAGIPLPCRAAEYSSKPNGTQQHVKRTNLWGWSNVRKGQRSELVDPSGEEELAIQRLEVMKNDLQIRIAKEKTSTTRAIQFSAFMHPNPICFCLFIAALELTLHGLEGIGIEIALAEADTIFTILFSFVRFLFLSIWVNTHYSDKTQYTNSIIFPNYFYKSKEMRLAVCESLFLNCYLLVYDSTSKPPSYFAALTFFCFQSPVHDFVLLYINFGISTAGGATVLFFFLLL